MPALLDRNYLQRVEPAWVSCGQQDGASLPRRVWQGDSLLRDHAEIQFRDLSVTVRIDFSQAAPAENENSNDFAMPARRQPSDQPRTKNAVN